MGSKKSVSSAQVESLRTMAIAKGVTRDEFQAWLDKHAGDTLDKMRVDRVKGTLWTEVDLDTLPDAAFHGAIVKQHVGDGKVVIEKRADGTYINGWRLGLRRLSRARIDGYELYVTNEIDKRVVINANATLNDFFVAHPEFVHDNLKTFGEGNSVLFMGTMFRREGTTCVYVSCGFWACDRWVSNSSVID